MVRLSPSKLTQKPFLLVTSLLALVRSERFFSLKKKKLKLKSKAFFDRVAGRLHLAVHVCLKY